MRSHVSNAFHASVLTGSGAIGIVLTLMVLLMGLLFSQEDAQAAPPPTTMNFQGRLADSSGNLMPDGLYNMQFRMFSASSGGSALWTETRQTGSRVQVTNGLFTVQLGEVTPLTASLFNATNLYFEITMPTPGTATCSTAACASWETPMSPRHKLATSAYAFNAASLNGFTETDFAAASGSNSYIQNTTTPQTANFSITGNGTANIFRATTFDRATSGTLTVGGTNATAITLADNTSVTGTLSVSSTLSASNLSGTNTGDISVSGQNYLTLVGQAITANAINLASNVTGTLPIANGGTGATTSQAAINALSQLTTNGDLLYHNGTNSTRLARGSNGQCLTSNATTLQWGSCGLTSESDTLASVTGRGASTTTAVALQGGATIRGLTVETAISTQDQIILSAAATGAARFAGTITNADLTGARTYTLPNASGTFAVSASGNIALSAAGDITFTGSLTDAQVSNTLTASNIVGTGSTTNAVDLGTAEVAGTLGVANGGTGSTSAQGAINNISGLTTNGDLLYHNGTNSIRLARGADGQCLTSTTTSLQWGSCDYGANTALSNLSGVAINTSLISDTNNTDDLGSSGIGWRSGYFGTAVYSPLLDRANAGTLTIGGTNATAITLADNTTINANLTVSAGNSLTLTGGNTASRPGSPSEGMVYFDSETDQLLTYANGKWQADRSDALLVAANNSSARDKASADYIADGTADQTEINSALTAASGKKVVLLAGTYTIDSTISVPNNTIISGVGDGTLVQLADIDVTVSMIRNSDLTTGTGVTVRDMKVDVRGDLNTLGNQHAVNFLNMGGGVGETARRGGLIENVHAVSSTNAALIVLASSSHTVVTANTLDNGYGGILMDNSTHNTVMANNVHDSGYSGIQLQNSSIDNTIAENQIHTAVDAGIRVQSSSNSNKIISNKVSDAATYGMYISAENNTVSNNSIIDTTYGMVLLGDGNTITGNTIEDVSNDGAVLQNANGNIFSSNIIKNASDEGIWIDSAATYNTVVGNNIETTGGNGIRLEGGGGDPTHNTVSNNTIRDSGGSTENFGIFLTDADYNSVADNRIFDSSCTSTCTAIQLQSTAGNNYVSNNVFSSTPGTSTLFNNNATNTLSNQPLAENGQNITNRSVNSTAAFQIQNASGTSLLVVDSTNTIIDVNAQLEVNFSSTATVNGVCHSGSDIDTTGTNRLLVACSAAPNDYAEFYPTDGNVQHGELVATTPNMLTYEAQGADAETGIIKSMGTKQISILKRAEAGDNVFGIVSTAPYQTIGKDIPVSANRMPIAMSGRVPLKVTNENGAIAAGDKLTISPTLAGHATKAVAAGNTYAVALEPMDDATGKIMVYVENNYYAPPIQGAATMSGDATLGSLSVAGNINVMGDASFTSLTVAQNLTVEGELLVVGKATTSELTVAGRITTKGEAPAVESGPALGTGEALEVSVEGTDGAGTLEVSSASSPTSGVIAAISLVAPYETDYKIIVSARNENAAKLRVYAVKTDTGFEIRSLDVLDPNATYTFDYITQGAAPL